MMDETKRDEYTLGSCMDGDDDSKKTQMVEVFTQAIHSACNLTVEVDNVNKLQNFVALRITNGFLTAEYIKWIADNFPGTLIEEQKKKLFLPLTLVTDADCVDPPSSTKLKFYIILFVLSCGYIYLMI